MHWTAAKGIMGLLHALNDEWIRLLGDFWLCLSLSDFAATAWAVFHGATEPA